MPDRILDVNAYTTFDLLDGRVEGHGFTDETLAVVNVTAPDVDGDDEPDHVELRVEMDNTDLSALSAHADAVVLSPAQARELAAELESSADDVEAADGE